MQQTTAQSQAYLIIQLGSRWTDILRLLPGQTIGIGRSSDNQIVIKDERASRRHAEISHHNGGWHLVDLGSRNGTQVGGVTVSGGQPLKNGDSIQIGGCQIIFADSLAGAFPGPPALRSQVSNTVGPGHSSVAEDSRPGEKEPTIVSRLSRSNWSAEVDPSEVLRTSVSPSLDKAPKPPTSSLQPTDSEKWIFFYRLVFELASSKTAEQAASIAVDRLLSELGISAGGIVQIDTDKRMAVLSARQSPGRSYHRVSDYLAESVLREGQAVLARNVQDDEQLSVARQSGRHETTSVLCAPIRVPSRVDGESIIGLLHVYTQPEERMLNPDDLHLAVGVADNLAIALDHLQVNEHLVLELDVSRRKVEQLEQELGQQNELVGRSVPMQNIAQTIRRVAPTQAIVLVRGESGVGKELVARAIHNASPRNAGPLVCLNCAALAPTLLESELFGHEKGSFTGATERKIGKFEAANRGTLFLDEIGEMPLELQAKFLRVLEGHPFERLGGSSPIRTDVRVIAATNRDLEEAVREKSFRSDLYFRLHVVELLVPPLRQRPDDIPLLVEHFLTLLRSHAHRRLLGVEPEVMEILARHSWPGNVRELRNVIERAVVLGTGSTIGVADLSLAQVAVDTPMASSNGSNHFEPIPLEELEKKHIMAMLDYVQGNKSKAAQLLGIERSTLDRKLKRF